MRRLLAAPVVELGVEASRDKKVGVNRLHYTIKDDCIKACMPSFYSNHSLRSTCATKLYQKNVDEELFQEVTGHRSLAIRSVSNSLF